MLTNYFQKWSRTYKYFSHCWFSRETGWQRKLKILPVSHLLLFLGGKSWETRKCCCNTSWPGRIIKPGCYRPQHLLLTSGGPDNIRDTAAWMMRVKLFRSQIYNLHFFPLWWVCRKKRVGQRFSKWACGKKTKEVSIRSSRPLCFFPLLFVMGVKYRFPDWREDLAERERFCKADTFSWKYANQLSGFKGSTVLKTSH